jgi:hypothetical protein
MAQTQIPQLTSSGSVNLLLVDLADRMTGLSGPYVSLQYYCIKPGASAWIVPSGSVANRGYGWLTIIPNHIDTNTAGTMIFRAVCSGSAPADVIVDVINNLQNPYIAHEHINTVSGSIQAMKEQRAGELRYAAYSGSADARTAAIMDYGALWGSNLASGAIRWGSLSGSLQATKEQRTTELRWAAYSGSVDARLPDTIDYGLFWNNANASGSIYFGSLSGSIQAIKQLRTTELRYAAYSGSVDSRYLSDSFSNWIS